MTKHLTRELDRVMTRLSKLGRQVSGQLDMTLEALLSADQDKALQVMAKDDEIDQEEVAIEEDCLKIIALHQPVTRALRCLITVMKVNNDLERIGDHAVNLAHTSKKLAEKEIRNFPPQIIKMGRMVTEACHNCIEAFINEDIDLAVSICHDDKAINELCGLVYDEAKRIIYEQRGKLGHAIHIYRVGHELERVGDLCKNIAEDTIYLITGEVVRHNQLKLLDLEAARMEG